MMFRYFIILAGILYSSAFSQENLIRNGSVEMWNDGIPEEWKIETSNLELEKDTLVFFEGQSSAKILLLSKDTQILSQDSIPIVGGNRYHLKMQLRENDDAGRLRFWGYWRGTDLSGGPQAPSYSKDNEDWQLYDMEVDVPSGASFMDLQIRFYDVSSKWDGDALFHIDAVSFKPSEQLKPDIFNVTDSVFMPDEKIKVDATIRDDQSVDDARLFYRHNNSGPTEVGLENTDHQKWKGEIPACQNGDKLEYWIEATDTEQNTSVSDTFRVVIGQSNIENCCLNDGDGRLLYKGFKSRFSGVVTVASGIFSEKQQNIFIQDTTGGINIFSEAKREMDLNYLDSIEVIGQLDQLHGRSIIRPEQIRIIAEQAQPPAIPVIECAEVSESLEGELVEIRDVIFDGWIESADTDFVAIISDGTAELDLVVYGQTDIDGHNNPSESGSISIRGIVSQIDEEAPYTDNYCIIPRLWSDLSITSIEHSAGSVSAFDLKQNFPNPFNPGTNITYHLDRPGSVRIDIYDILGKKIDTITDGKQMPGNHSVTWNGKRYPSGIYFYVLSMDNRKIVRKMILTK